MQSESEIRAEIERQKSLYRDASFAQDMPWSANLPAERAMAKIQALCEVLGESVPSQAEIWKVAWTK